MLKVDKYGRWIFEHSIITPQGYIKAIKGDKIEYTQEIELAKIWKYYRSAEKIVEKFDNLKMIIYSSDTQHQFACIELELLNSIEEREIKWRTM